MSSSSLDNLGPELYPKFTSEEVSQPENSLGGWTESPVPLSETDNVPNDEHKIKFDVFKPRNAINNVQSYLDVSIPVSVASIGHHIYNRMKWVR